MQVAVTSALLASSAAAVAVVVVVVRRVRRQIGGPVRRPVDAVELGTRLMMLEWEVEQQGLEIGGIRRGLTQLEQQRDRWRA